MRILVAADGLAADIYAQAFCDAFGALGHEVRLFTWKEYFKHYPYADRYPTDGNRLKSVYYRAQNKLTFGPAMWAINRDLVRTCKSYRPDMVFVYRGTHVWPRTLRMLKKLGARVFGYNNDDPFSKVYPAYFWRHFLRGVHLYDHVFAYRFKNLYDYRKMGMERTSLLRSYYLKKLNFADARAKKAAGAGKVVFIGHFEDDGRDEAILALLDAGVPAGLYGTGWEKSRHYEALARRLGDIRPVYGAAYNRLLNQACMALVFLSKLNNDTYTRRCFEITATKTPMVAEYTEDMAFNLFEAGKEAVYFDSVEELVRQVTELLKNPARLKKIGEAGHARLMRDGHEVTDRARQVLRVYEDMQQTAGHGHAG